TPMQWSAEGGFSPAPPSRYRSPMPDGPFGPRHVNVEDQLVDPDSLFGFVSALARSYRQSPEIGWGRFELLEHTVVDQDGSTVLAHGCRTETERFVAVHNLSDEPEAIRLQVGEEPEGTVLVDLADGQVLDVVDDGCE